MRLARNTYFGLTGFSRTSPDAWQAHRSCVLAHGALWSPSMQASHAVSGLSCLPRLDSRFFLSLFSFWKTFDRFTASSILRKLLAASCPSCPELGVLRTKQGWPGQSAILGIFCRLAKKAEESKENKRIKEELRKTRSFLFRREGLKLL